MAALRAGGSERALADGFQGALRHIQRALPFTLQSCARGLRRRTGPDGARSSGRGIPPRWLVARHADGRRFAVERSGRRPRDPLRRWSAGAASATFPTASAPSTTGARATTMSGRTKRSARRRRRIITDRARGRSPRFCHRSSRPPTTTSAKSTATASSASKTAPGAPARARAADRPSPAWRRRDLRRASTMSPNTRPLCVRSA